MLKYVAVGGSAALLCWLLMRRRSRSPLDAIPGPKVWPLFGNAWQLDIPKLFTSLAELRNQYGGIFRLYIFSLPVVVVSDKDLVHEVLLTQTVAFAGRPCSYRSKILSENLLGISMTDEGLVHTNRRRVLHNYLHQFGAGIQRLEEVTMGAADDLINRFSGKVSTPFDIQDDLFHCVTDVIMILLIGQTIDEEDKMHELKTLLEQGFTSKHHASGMVLDMFPFTRFLGNKRYKEFQHVIKIKDKIVSGWLEDRPAEGFINFLQAMPEEEQKQNFLHLPSDQSKTVFEFLGAGVFTTFTTLTCLMNVLCHYPQVQQKLQDEIYNVIGPSRHPTMKDREAMPYLRATILEITRFVSVAPIAIPHKTTVTCRLAGYTIPQDTQIWVNLWTLHHDEELWDEPFQFKPERFLDSDGQLVLADHPNRKNLLPFGAGHRVCVGEVFAVNRMFLIIARILQNFSILPESTVAKQPSCDPRDMSMGIALRQEPFKVRLLLMC